MQVLIHKLRGAAEAAVVTLFALLLFSCANAQDKQAANQANVVKDPDAANKNEGQLPWNKQESWETQGSNLSGITDRR